MSSFWEDISSPVSEGEEQPASTRRSVVKMRELLRFISMSFSVGSRRWRMLAASVVAPPKEEFGSMPGEEIDCNHESI
jgi:hypothetical protein